MIWFLAYAAAGAFVGLLAGMLGIGGGMTLVPILAALFDAEALAPGHGVHLALGSAMASAVVTALASVRAQHLRGSVDWRIAARLAPGMVLGSILSSTASGWIPQRHLALAFALAFALIVYGGATQMLLGRRADATVALPGRVATLLIGLAIGVVCGLVSAGGAFLTIPWTLFCGVPMLTAIGTGVAMAVPVVFVGTVGYVATGWHVQGLPPQAIGFVYLPALAALVLASSPMASAGARLAHRLPVVVLKRIFALLLYVLATRMVVHYW